MTLPQAAEREPVQVTLRRCGVVFASSGSELDVEGVLNPGVTRDREGRLVLYPRLVAAGNVSRIGLAVARETAHGPVFGTVDVALAPEMPYERRALGNGYGCEDPRVTYVAPLDLYVMAYCAYGPRGPRVALAVSEDAYRWRRLGLVEFADARIDELPNKDGAFFPDVVRSPAGVASLAFYHRPMLRESVNGQAPIGFIESLRPEQREVTCIAYVPLDAVRRDLDRLRFVSESVVVLPVGERWGTLKNGAGTPPVRTPAGWLSFFHGVDAVERGTTPSLYYRAGIVVHDLERPDRVVYRSPEPLLDPETVEERFGIVDDVVFPTGIDVLGEGRYDVYYGAADAKIARLAVTATF